MGELDSLHCIFQITLTECLAQGHLFFFKKKQNRNLKTKTIKSCRTPFLIQKQQISKFINLNKTMSNLN